MTETYSTQGGPPGLTPDEVTPGMPVWAHLFKKRPDIPAIITNVIDAPDGGMLCQLILEIEDPFSNEISRQPYKKPVPSSLLTYRQLRGPTAAPPTPAATSTPATDVQEREDDPTKQQATPKQGRKTPAKDLRARVTELERENALLELYRPAMIEGAWRQLGESELARRDLRYHLDEGERAFTRLAARLEEVEAYHPQLSQLKGEAAKFRDHYRRILYKGCAGVPPDPEQKSQEEATPPAPEPQPEAEQWTRYSQLDLRRYHDERRAWLATWAAAHNYRTLPYRSHWRGKGYLAYAVPEGKKAWESFLTHTWPYLAYCAFIEAYAPGQIEHYLTEAAARGDIQLDGDPQTPAQIRQAWEDQLSQADLTHYSKGTLLYQGPHDQVRRAWLHLYGEQKGYPEFWFTIYGTKSGPYKAGIAKGEEGWTHFLNKAVQFDVYCCFVAAYAPGQIEELLKDAEQRGEIKLTDTLVWKASNHATPR